jgi:hypothetical protein
VRHFEGGGCGGVILRKAIEHPVDAIATARQVSFAIEMYSPPPRNPSQTLFDNFLGRIGSFDADNNLAASFLRLASRATALCVRFGLGNVGLVLSTEYITCHR